jgi:rod shape-determining protein MreB and related proteins
LIRELPRKIAEVILHQVLRHSTGLPVSIADDPLACVVLGAGRCLEEMKALKAELIDS